MSKKITIKGTGVMEWWSDRFKTQHSVSLARLATEIFLSGLR